MNARLNHAGAHSDAPAHTRGGARAGFSGGTHTDTATPMRWAMLALDYGVEALREAERDGAPAGEIIRLCDEVIARRLRVQMLRLESDSPPPADLVAQIERDRRLLAQPSYLDD